MDKKELNEIVKQHPEVKALRKSSIGLSIILLIASIVLLFINRLMGIIGICAFPILVLCYWIAYKGKIKDIRKRTEEYGEEWLESQNDANSQRVAPNRLAVDAAASYAIGKAVTNRSKQSPLTENPYHKKQEVPTQAASRAITSKYVCKMGKTNQCCGTCQYWCGDRELDAVNHGRIANIVSKDGKCACKRGQKHRTSVGYSKTCSEWEKWSDLR